MRNFEWTHLATDRYLVTGRYYQSNARFRFETAQPYRAMYTNLYDGRVWLLRDGKRILVKRVTP